MSTCINVTTQAELDAALARDGFPCIHLKGDGEFEISSSDSATVRASDSATVRASDSATVRASDSATVRAYDSATVSASDSATVSAYGSATVSASGSATVSASGSATVSAYDSATVSASGSATVSAYDSATVRAYDSATVRAGGYVAVHQLSKYVTITGGHVITPPDLRRADAATWLSYHGIEPDENGVVILFKALDDQWTTDRGFDYSPGATPEAPDWKPDNECGAGLHVSPTPVHAMAFHSDATRFAACPVRVDEISVIDQQKVKVRRIVEPGCRPVDIDGQPLVIEESESESESEPAEA